MRHRQRSLGLGWLAGLVFAVAIAPGCNPSAKEIMQQSFARDPAVSVEYQPDGSKIFKTRNIVLFADFGRSQLSSLVMLVALSGESAVQDSLGQAGGLMKFRSIDRIPHFEASRNLVITMRNRHFDLGPCAYVQDTLSKGGTVEDLTVIVPQGVVKEMATADDIEGIIGEMPFELTGEDLLPIRMLVDTLAIR